MTNKISNLEHTQDEFFDTAKFEPTNLVPGRLAYVWLYGRPGSIKDGNDGLDWPVNGWAPYLIWRWTKKYVEVWHVSHLTRIKVPLDHAALKQPRHCPTDKITPKYIADRLDKRMALYGRTGLSFLVGCEGIASFLRKLPSFDVEVTPALESEVTSISGQGDAVMAKTNGKTDAPKKMGSGAWIREQLLLKNVKTDEEIAALAREKFGGRTGVSDVAWNRNRLRREGLLPPVERKAKAAPKKEKANAAPPKKGKRQTITSTADAEAAASDA